MLSKKEANSLLDTIDLCLRCTGEEDLKRLVVGLRSLVPYEFALCALAAPSCRSTDPYRLINVSYPTSWLELYISDQLDRFDPIVTEHRLHLGLQYWVDSYRKHPEAEKFVAAASDHGLRSGYSYGMKTPGGGHVSLFCFGGRSMERQSRICHILQLIVPHLHQALVRIEVPFENRVKMAEARLSAREKEVLKWVKAGKTTWEISMILSISQRTVKFHVRNILQKFNASTRAEAVAISVEEGLIDID